MLKSKSLTVYSMMVGFVFIMIFYSRAYSNENHFHASYIKAYCMYNQDNNIFDLKIENKPNHGSVIDSTFNSMRECKLMLKIYEQDYCTQTNACPSLTGRIRQSPL